MKNKAELYDFLKNTLSQIDIEKIQEAHEFLIHNYRNKINLTSDDFIKAFLTGTGGKWVKKDENFASFFSGKPKSYTDFRYKTLDPSLIKEVDEKKRQKNIERLIEKIAFYWTLFECFDDSDLQISLRPNSIVYPIVFESLKYKLNYPPEFEKNNFSYIGFYPRSGFGRSTDIGVFALELYSNGTIVEDKFRNGEFEMSVYYSDHTLSVKGLWEEEINQSVCFLRTTNDYPNFDILVDDFNKEEKLNKLILSQINIQDRLNDKTPYILGTVNTTNREEGFSFCSMAVFLKKDYVKQKFSLTKVDDSTLRMWVKEQSSKFFPEIRYFLYEQRLSLNYSSDAKSKEIPFSNEVHIIKSYAGFYQGYFLKEKESSIFLERFGIEILEDGRINDLAKGGKHYNGFVNYVNSESSSPTWIVNLHLSEQEDLYQLNFALESGYLSEDVKKKYFRGVYIRGGYEQPSAGKVFLERVTDVTEINFIESDLFNYTDFKWDSHGELRSFFSNSFLNSGRNFFPGLRQFIPVEKRALPKYFEGKRLAIFTVFIDEITSDEKKHRFVYRQLKFKKMPIDFKSGNSFVMEISQGREVWGTYTIEYDKLILTVSESAYFERFYFSLYDAQEPQIKFEYAFGVFSSFNRIQNPQSQAAMLMVIDENESFFQIFDNPLSQKSNVNSNRVNAKAATFLYTGIFNRIIHLPRKKDTSISVNFDSSRRSFFYSAVYIWQNQEKDYVWDKQYNDSRNSKALCIDYLIKALINGFAVPNFLGNKRIKSKERTNTTYYPQELSTDFDMLLDFLSQISDSDLKGEIREIFEIV
jgi:hypothetical protein